MSTDIIVPCRDPDAAARMLGELGFVVEMVVPADAPAVIVVAGHGARMRLVRDGIEPPPLAAVARPSGVAFAIHRNTAWHAGRAGMLYRDLVPDRLGGWLIASHIRIPDAGPVPDYVHHHAISVQLIYCRAGWVRVVYEDQGDPFVLEPGDCVTQPPGIRHRVLECSANLEVIELASPAAHPTFADHALALPNGTRDRTYGGQRFTRYRAGAARGGDIRDLGLDEPTQGLARGLVVRGTHTTVAPITFGFVLDGEVALGAHALVRDDAFVAPPGETYTGGTVLEISLA